MRIPQRPNDVCNPQKSSSKTCAALNNQNKESADATKVVHSAVNGSHLGSKRKDFSTITDAVPLRTIIPVIDDKDDDEIMMWSGPKKPRPEPLKCNKPITVSDPIYRQPKRRIPEKCMENVGSRPSSGHILQREHILQRAGENGESHARSSSADPDGARRESTSRDSEVQTEKLISKLAPKKAVIIDANSSRGNEGSSDHMPLRDPLCHRPIVTPPCPIKPADMHTPTDLQTYTHAPDLPARFIPGIFQEFETFQEAYDFYNTYAKYTGFGIKKGQHNGSRRYLQCVREGKHRKSVNEDERKRDKLSKRTGCKAMIRLKEKSDGTCVVKDVMLEHNHPLLLSPSMMAFMHSHKKLDSNLKDLVKDLHSSNVKHVNIMALLSKMHDGRGNLPFNDKDVLNM